VNRAIEACVIAFGVSALLTPVVRGFCIRFGIFDAPGPLKIHQRPIPRLGGIAIAIAIAAGSFFAKPLPSGPARFFFAALGLVLIVGLIDDVRGLPPLARLSAQAAAALLLWRDGFHFALFGNSGWNALAICALVIFFTNAFNFLDGSDGLAAGVSAVVALAYLSAATNTSHLNGVAASLLGAAVGFLIYNLPPASVFMGDSGSTALGFTAAFLTLSFLETQAEKPSRLTFSLLVAALPLFDASLAVIRRLRAAKSAFAGDRLHYYDLMAARRWSAKRIAFVSYATTALLGAIGWIGLRMQPWHFAVLAAVIFATLLLIALRLGSLAVDLNPAISAKSTTEKGTATTTL
jgi:UDP-GlcNAc:undecaprenyl-phosphate/decaprenyl-phosphate GlcNAc-1-phosphate transferase